MPDFSHMMQKTFCHNLFNTFQRKERVFCFQHAAFNYFVNKSIQIERQKVLLVIVWLVYAFICVA